LFPFVVVPLFRCHELWGGGRGLDTVVKGKGAHEKNEGAARRGLDAGLWPMTFCRNPPTGALVRMGHYGA